VLWSKQDCVGMVRLKFLDQLATPLPATSQQAHPPSGLSSFRAYPKGAVPASSLSDWSLADRGMERRFALREPATGC
jgi:hypothetical protein